MNTLVRLVFANYTITLQNKPVESVKDYGAKSAMLTGT